MAITLPTALRPPQQPPSTSAALSPDAPADPLLSELNRGQTGTAGAGSGTVGAGPSSTLPPPPPPAPRSCPNGVGTPPRQVESWYSAPCSPVWSGDNGGATYKGVTATEIRIGIAVKGGGNGGMDTENPGPISDEPQPDEGEAERTWRVYQRYFNENFQLYGRRIRFIVNNPDGEASGDAPATLRRAVAELDEQYGVFAVHSYSTPALEEAARRQMVGFGGWQLPGRLYRDNQPYLYSWYTDGTTQMRFAAEYLCKQLSDRTADFAGAGVAGKPRVFGLVLADHVDFGPSGGHELPDLVEAQCGEDFAVVASYSAYDGQNQQAIVTTMARMQQAGVTTIALATDPIFFVAMLNQADAQGYFPEWFVTGTWGTDWSSLAVLFQYSRTQWEHAFGVSPRTMYGADAAYDWYRAYKSIDPANDPDGDAAQVFPQLLQIVNGIQMAGPDLTPESFARGMAAMGRRPSDPSWTVGGGYGPGDFSYADDVAIIWWDPDAPAVSRGGAPIGSYRYVDCGRRYGLGELPTGAPSVFENRNDCTVAPGMP